MNDITRDAWIEGYLSCLLHAADQLGAEIDSDAIEVLRRYAAEQYRMLQKLALQVIDGGAS